MRRLSMMLITVLSLPLLAGGCGAITASSVMMKGATWAAGEAGKKVYKHWREEHDQKSADKRASRSTDKAASTPAGDHADRN